MSRSRTMQIKNDCSRRIRCALEKRCYGDVDLSGLIERAGEGDLDAMDTNLSSILEHVGEEDLDVIRPLLPDLLGYHYWVVRADALELVAKFHLSEFLGLVEISLRDRNWVVRGYALTAYYDLVGSKALPLLENASKDRAISYRVTALALRYVETRDEAVLNELRGILKRKHCRYTHRYAALSIFDAYLDVGLYPEIIQLFDEIRRCLADIPRKYGLDKDIPAAISRWRQSARSQRNTEVHEGTP